MPRERCVGVDELAVFDFDGAVLEEDFRLAVLRRALRECELDLGERILIDVDREEIPVVTLFRDAVTPQFSPTGSTASVRFFTPLTSTLTGRSFVALYGISSEVQRKRPSPMTLATTAPAVLPRSGPIVALKVQPSPPIGISTAKSTGVLKPKKCLPFTVFKCFSSVAFAGNTSPFPCTTFEKSNCSPITV